MKNFYREFRGNRLKTIAKMVSDTSYTLVGTPAPWWQSSDWDANYEPPSTAGSTDKDHFTKRIYYTDRYRRS